MNQSDKLDAIGGLLSENGCDCDCDHSQDEHDADCARCLACRITMVILDLDYRGGPLP